MTGDRIHTLSENQMPLIEKDSLWKESDIVHNLFFQKQPKSNLESWHSDMVHEQTHW